MLQKLRLLALILFVSTCIPVIADEVKPGVYRTPDEHFANLPGYDFQANYQYIDGYRIHYVDEGPENGPVVLLLHGEPSWSYLYRKMIPIFAEAGYRTIAPDLLGFGKSDKPADRGDYSYAGHVEIITTLIDEMGLTDISAFFQDWGGLIGLRVVAENPDRFKQVAIGNTTLPAGPGEDGIIMGQEFDTINPDVRLEEGDGFMEWLQYSQQAPELNASFLLQWGTVSELSADVLAAYDAPFPDSRYKAGARVMPTLVQSQNATNREAWNSLAGWNKPFLTAFSDKDPLLSQAYPPFQQNVPGALGQPHTTIMDAGHFLQEEKGEELATYLLDWFSQ